MSNRRKAQTIQALDALVGCPPIPGGCPDCNAEVTLERDESGVYHITIHHDPTCPMLAGATH